MLAQDSPAALGLRTARWERALRLIDTWCQSGILPATAVCFVRGTKTTGVHLFGRQSTSSESPPIRDDAIFLVASITKPIVASAVLLLVERGQLALDDRVEEYVPEFGREGKHAVTVRHLLTHTSGLADMLPNNFELRAAQASLAEFVAGACASRLDFLPGQGVQYQSLGFAMLGEIIRRVTGIECARFLKDEIFQPLEMIDTALGAQFDWFQGSQCKANRIAEVAIPTDSEMGSASASSWNWNSSYWRRLGAPWGGLLTTPADLARLAAMQLRLGAFGDRRILSRASVEAATRNQLLAMRDVPEEDRRTRPWGLGWRLNWPAHSANFGDLLGPRSYGHWGATGTLMWIDPDLDAALILLTTKPQEPRGSYLARASSAIVAAIE
jgi:CubicO group peptidase (beta-lactamase class C family)